MPPLYKRTPVEFFGYPHKCCHCIPLKAAAIIICVFSFLWVMVELSRSERYINLIFEGADAVIVKIARALHLFILVLFLIACGVLMIGIITQRSVPIHVFIWTAFIFNCICIVTTIVATAFEVMNTEKLPRKTYMKLVMAIFWYSPERFPTLDIGFQSSSTTSSVLSASSCLPRPSQEHRSNVYV